MNENDIRSLTSLQSYLRGEEYYRAGLVGPLTRRGNLLTAAVSGSAARPYQVAITLNGDELVSATCDCPYDRGDACKHIVAALLAATREPDQLEDRPPVDTLLADLDRETLRKLLRNIMALHPDLVTWLEAQLALPKPSSAKGHAKGPAGPTVDSKAIRRLVRSALNTSHDFEYGGSASVISSLEEVLALAQHALEQDDGASALTIIEEIGDNIIPGWEEYDDSDGNFSDFFAKLGATATEALLTADLSRAERGSWAEGLETWLDQLADYGVDTGFGAAIAAAREGWDNPQLQRKLAGLWSESDDEGFDDDFEDDANEEWSEEDDWSANDLLTARLNVLERQGRNEEFLNLALAEGEDLRYAVKLGQLDRIDAALAHGLHHFVLPEQTLRLAKTLEQLGHMDAALQIGEHGLDLLEGRQNLVDQDFARAPLGELARWVREAAASRGNSALALRAARTAFEEERTLADYRAVARLAGDEWPALKPTLLARLQTGGGYDERIDIFLFEGMVDAAIRVIDGSAYTRFTDLSKVAAAAIASRPDWVITRCRQQAEGIMDATKSKYYPDALSWLDLVRRAYAAAGRAEDWRSYCQELLITHKRKYKLTPGLQSLLNQ